MEVSSIHANQNAEQYNMITTLPKICRSRSTIKNRRWDLHIHTGKRKEKKKKGVSYNAQQGNSL